MPEIADPIVGLSLRTPHEVFSIMCKRAENMQRPSPSQCVQALEWYGEQVEALARHSAVPNENAMLAIYTTLFLDAGNRAKAALASQVPEVQGSPEKTHIDTVFTAFQQFALNTKRAGTNKAQHEAARQTFMQQLGPLASHIDWTEE